MDHIKELSGGYELLDSRYGEGLEAFIVTCKSDDCDQVRDQYQAICDDASASEAQKIRAKNILAIIKDFDWRGGIGALDYLVQKIEVVSHFKA